MSNSRITSRSCSRPRLALATLAAVCLSLVVSFAPPAQAIVGGALASEDYPNMAAFLVDGEQYCGASLVAPEWILTAAHCVDSLEPDRYSFRIGGAKDLAVTGGETIDAAQVIVHPEYGDVFDVALFRLERPSTYDPIRLASPVNDRDLWEPGDMARVIGYGGPFFQTPSPDEKLREIDIPIVDDADCDASYDLTFGGIDERVEVCAGETTGLKDSCQGDSGGPLMARDEMGEFVQVGVVSWGFGCGLPTQYGVYSRVGDELLYDWIQDTMAAPREELPPPPPDPTYESVAVAPRGFIEHFTPAGEVSSVTREEFLLECSTELKTQGFDGYVWELPEGLAVPGSFAKVTGEGSYDLDLSFFGWDNGCYRISGMGSAEPDERAEIPDGTTWVMAFNFLGDPTPVDLTVEVPQPLEVLTSLEIRGSSDSAGTFGQEATWSARLSDGARGLADQPVRFALVDENGRTVHIAAGSATDEDGISSVTSTLEVPAGAYTLEATYVGAPNAYKASKATAPFEVHPAQSAVSLTTIGAGSKRSLEAGLTDAIGGFPLAGRDIEFFADCTPIGSATTGEDGKASISVPAGYRSHNVRFTAIFRGDQNERYYSGSYSGPNC